MVKKIIDLGFIAIIIVGLSACSSMQVPYQAPLPPVTIYKEVKQNIQHPPMPQEMQLRDVEWFVLNNTPCRPATGENKNPKYYTHEKYQKEEYTKEDGTTGTRVVKDAEGNRIPLPTLVDENGNEIMVCGNIDQKIAEIEKKIGGDFVMIGMTIKDYENMSWNVQEFSRFSKSLRNVVLYYYDVTGGNENNPEGWKKQTEENREEALNNAKQESQQLTPQPAQPEEKQGFSLSNLIPGLPDSKD